MPSPDIETPAYFGDIQNPPGADPILILSTEYTEDPRESKINAGIGVINGEDGNLWVPLAVVKAAERTPVLTGNYIGPHGEIEWTSRAEFIEGSIQLVFQDHADRLLSEERVAAIATSGGTHALSLFAEALKMTQLGQGAPPEIILGNPPYPNHPSIFIKRGLKLRLFPQVMADGSYDIQANIKAILDAPKGSVVLFHRGAHNPTGIDPENLGQWDALAYAAKSRQHRVFFDAPYLGLRNGMVDDTEPIRHFMEVGVPVAVAISYSKIAAMYSQRTGALLIPMPNTQQALEATRVLNSLMRTDTSSPSAVGETLMSHIFVDPELSALWNTNLEEVTEILKKRRRLLCEALPDHLRGPISKGAGLFTMLPLSDEAIIYLKKQHAVYVVGSGRVNIGGIPTRDIPRFAAAVYDAMERFPIQNI